MKMAGIVFSNIHDSTIAELTSHRTVASLPFGGRYRLIDFVLSNMVNSGINTVGVITKYNYQSLLDHLGSCSEWGLNIKNEGLYFIPPFSSGSTGIYRGKIDAMYGAMTFLKKCNSKYILMSDTTVICNIDYNSALKYHIDSGSDVTVIACKEKASFLGERRELILKVTDGIVSDVRTNAKFDDTDLCSMGMYIIEREMLINKIENCISHGRYNFEADYILKEFNKNRIKIGVFEFFKVILRIDNITSYFLNNLKLMEESVRDDIFSVSSPIYTKVRDEVPAYYGKNSQVNDCLIADGCNIYGYVENSVIFRNVTIEEGCSVKNSIVMQCSRIGKGAELNYAILDKNVQVSEYATLSGSIASPLIINKGKVV